MHRTLFLLCAGLLMAGCATGDFAMLTTIATGEKIHVPLGKGGVVMSEEDGVKIAAATFTVTQDKKISFFFEFNLNPVRPVSHIKVEDVSEAPIVTWIDDAHPNVSAAGHWRGDTPPVELHDSRIGWLDTVSNSLRVFRFTLTLADGKTVVLDQGALYPSTTKAALHVALGEK